MPFFYIDLYFSGMELFCSISKCLKRKHGVGAQLMEKLLFWNFYRRLFRQGMVLSKTGDGKRGHNGQHGRIQAGIICRKTKVFAEYFGDYEKFR